MRQMPTTEEKKKLTRWDQHLFWFMLIFPITQETQFYQVRGRYVHPARKSLPETSFQET